MDNSHFKDKDVPQNKLNSFFKHYFRLFNHRKDQNQWQDVHLLFTPAQVSAMFSSLAQVGEF